MIAELDPEAKKFVDANFFYLDSENMDSAVSRMIGFALIDNILYIGDYPHGAVPHFSDGTYVNIVIKDDIILIQQDHIGCFGLFYFKQGDFFAISNSFVLLVEKLPERYPLSLNKEYISQFLQLYNSIAFPETIFNEIYCVPLYSDVVINRKIKEMSFVSFCPRYNLVDICSAEAFALIDFWHDKWHRLVTFLVENNQLVRVELTGGRDSRACLSIIRKPNIMNPMIYLYSSDMPLPGYKEDHQIANQIANVLGLNLHGKEPHTKVCRIENDLTYLLSFLVKGCFHSMYGMSGGYHKAPVFTFGGFGGELNRDHWAKSWHSLRKCFPPFTFTESQFANGANISVHRTFENLARYANEELIGCDLIWSKVVMPIHFGRTAAEEWLQNKIRLIPLADLSLLKIKQRLRDDSRLLLYTVLYDRFLPETAPVDFLKYPPNKDIWQMARRLNRQFPYMPAATVEPSGLNLRSRSEPCPPPEPVNPWKRDTLEACSKEITAGLGAALWNDIETYYNQTPQNRELFCRRVDALAWAVQHKRSERI